MDDFGSAGLDAVTGIASMNPSGTGPVGSEPLNSEQASVARRAWLVENQAALDAFDRWYEDNGSPLDKYRAS